ncbi:hypothetical protein MDOR_17710 [Mycolicibacterium doricum]|uniref:Uncharacterized protein n=1 Tax=Mycolicibacterium doricum TaxID=126673 RepID=A0A7I7VSJ7_9MYCO|nr:hypothetical protein [Mycolicibacterium doricum]BBZ07602.1 hypothetical protein MDOR_17710 [Mycolicibacterium doricum]
MITIPAWGWARLRIPFKGYRGRSVYHCCHILDHEDAGMTAVGPTCDRPSTRHKPLRAPTSVAMGHPACGRLNDMTLRVRRFHHERDRQTTPATQPS